MSQPRHTTIHKERGQTPLQALELWREGNPELAHLPATYAGRLDPMAEGKLLLLLGDECKRRNAYLGLDKEYEVEVVLSASTDTGDLLGLPTPGNSLTVPTQQQAHSMLKQLTGSTELPYPAFSSKTVSGVPLFEYALRGTLDTIEIPTHTETIHRIQVLAIDTFSHAQFAERVAADLSQVPRTSDPAKRLGADFRQDAVRAAWQEVLGSEERAWPRLRIRVTCASGTYMRTLASRIGTALDTRAFALSINRTKLGRYHSFGPFRFWSNEY